MKRRRKHTGCAVEAHKGHLRLRFRWHGQRYARTTALVDTAENRAQLQKLANLVAATIAAGKDPLVLLQSKTEEGSAPKPHAMTVHEYFTLWIADKVPPVVRKAQARDYRRHVEGYILEPLGDIALAELTARDILGLRAQLLQRGLSLKYVKNILGGSFKAMIRDAREIDRVITGDPFVGVRWGRVPVPGPEPFTADERSRILGWFEHKRFGFHCGVATEGPRMHVHPPYYASAHMLFWTGMRPSEAAALRWKDVDLEGRVVRIVRSRHLYEESAPKTAQAMRTVELFPETARILRSIEPLRVTPDMYVFTTTSGGPIEPKAFSTHWYRCLRALDIRVRGMYATKDTYISTALTAGVNTSWLEAQTGVRYETLRRHYGSGYARKGRISSKKWPVWPPRVSRSRKLLKYQRKRNARRGT